MMDQVSYKSLQDSKKSRSAVIKKTMFPIHEYYSSKDSTHIIILPMLILAGMIIIGVNEYWYVISIQAYLNNNQF